MEAHVFRKSGEWFVSIRLAGVEVDEAGPFDDEFDANEMALRSGAEIFPYNHRTTSEFTPELLISYDRLTVTAEAA